MTGRPTPARELTADQAAAVLAAADQDGPRAAALVALVLYCGLEPLEVRNADVAHLTTGAGGVSMLRLPGARPAMPTLALVPPPAARRVARYLETRPDQPPTGPLLITSTGGRLDRRWIHRKVAQLGQTAGVPGLNPRSLSRTREALTRHLTGATLADVLNPRRRNRR